MRTQLNLRDLARRQRWMLWLVLGMLLLQALPMTVPVTPMANASAQSQSALLMVMGVANLAVYALAIVGVVLLLIAQGNHIFMIILCGLFMIAPCGNLLILLLVNMSATRTLRLAGIRVGFMGACLDEVEHIINPALCSQCGYNLTGNVSGVCPECGRAALTVETVAPPTTPPAA